jgi:hypothetical protein
VWGGWKRRMKGGDVVIELGPLDVLDKEETAALEKAAGDLARFLGTSVTIERRAGATFAPASRAQLETRD